MQEWYKKNPTDEIWWLDNLDVIGEMIFSFDKKTEMNLFTDYPHKLTETQKAIFDKENPYWANFLMNEKEK